METRLFNMPTDERRALLNWCDNNQNKYILTRGSVKVQKVVKVLLGDAKGDVLATSASLPVKVALQRYIEELTIETLAIVAERRVSCEHPSADICHMSPEHAVPASLTIPRSLVRACA